MTLQALSDRRAVALFALSLAARPLADDFADSDAETIAVSRPDFVALLRSSGVAIGRNRAYSVLNELAAENAPALRLIRHAGTATLVLGLLGLTEDIDAGWEGVLVDSVDTALDTDELEDDGELEDDELDLVTEALALLSGLGLETSSPLPPMFSPRLSRIIPAAKRCPACQLVISAELYGTRDGRLRSHCRLCERDASRTWRLANPEEAKRAGRHVTQTYRPRQLETSHRAAYGPRDRGLGF
jgi:hypothetical protein